MMVQDREVRSLVQAVAHDYRSFSRGALGVLASEIAAIPHLRRLVCLFADKKKYPERPVILLSKEPTIYLLGWREGDGTGVHDHGLSEVGIKVIQGSITEDLFVTKPAEDRGRDVLLTFSRQLDAGALVTCPGNYIHRFTNVFPEVAATLHVYGPKSLSRMTSWEDETMKLRFKEYWHA